MPTIDHTTTLKALLDLQDRTADKIEALANDMRARDGMIRQHLEAHGQEIDFKRLRNCGQNHGGM